MVKIKSLRGLELWKIWPWRLLLLRLTGLYGCPQWLETYFSLFIMYTTSHIKAMRSDSSKCRPSHSTMCWTPSIMKRPRIQNHLNQPTAVKRGPCSSLLSRLCNFLPGVKLFASLFCWWYALRHFNPLVSPFWSWIGSMRLFSSILLIQGINSHSWGGKITVNLSVGLTMQTISESD